MGRRKGPSLTRDDVVNAALACIHAEGPDAAGVSRVARELGIRPPSLYNHVANGDDLVRAVVVEANRRLVAVLEGAVANLQDPTDQLRALAWALWRWAAENAHLYEFLSRVPPPNDDPEFAPVVERMLGLFADPLRALGVPDGDLIHATRALRAALHGFLVLQTTGQFQLADDPEESFAFALRALLRGLRPGAPEPA